MPWGHLEVMVEYVVAPIGIILNDLITHAHLSGSKPIPPCASILKHWVNLIDLNRLSQG